MNYPNIDFDDTQAINKMVIGDSQICWYPTETFTIKNTKLGRYTIYYHNGDVVFFQKSGEGWKVYAVLPHDGKMR